MIYYSHVMNIYAAESFHPVSVKFPHCFRRRRELFKQFGESGQAITSLEVEGQ